MASPTDGGDVLLRNKIAVRILAASAIAITVLGIVAIWSDPAKNAMMIFNITLPVFSSWVGTVLAFYFGRENFESAIKSSSDQVRASSDQVRELLAKVSPEERASAPVSSVMRRLTDTTHVKLTAAKGEAQTTLKEMRALLTGDVSRLPVIDENSAPKYLIHGSSISQYIADGGKEDDTLGALLAKLGQSGAFGAGHGFVLVGMKDKLADAKAKMEAASGCQDIFVTADGAANQPLQGWISNIRLGKFLQP